MYRDARPTKIINCRHNQNFELRCWRQKLENLTVQEYQRIFVQLNNYDQILLSRVANFCYIT